MKDKDEYIEGDKSVIKTWLFYFCLYLLFLLWLEPIIDFLLSLDPPQPDPAAIEAFNDRKRYIANIVFAFARSFPIMLFFWLGYIFMASGRMPPKGIRLPFTVKVVKGQTARMYGMMIMGVSVLLLFRELAGLSGI